MYSPNSSFKAGRSRTTTITIESRDYRGNSLITTRKVSLLDDLEQYDCALCAGVHIEAILPDGRKLEYKRGRI